MTWEYLIGSEKDFVGAPDWCTHSSLMFWLMDSSIKIGNKFQMKGVSRVNVHSEHNSLIGSKIGIIAQRRKRKSTEWNGEGLPPVGCVCEALITGGWRKVKVVFSGDDLELNAAGEFVVVDLENTHLSWADEFRPLRTKEQIERDETVNKITNLVEALRPFKSSREIAECMFDEGYRKTK